LEVIGWKKTTKLGKFDSFSPKIRNWPLLSDPEVLKKKAIGMKKSSSRSYLPPSNRYEKKFIQVLLATLK
jgi:hypothetical protein